MWAVYGSASADESGRRHLRSDLRALQSGLDHADALSLLNCTARIALAACLLVAARPHAIDAQQPSWSTEHVDETLRSELDAISARGRLLAEYDQAAWHGTDAVLALKPVDSLVRGYLARRRADGLWEVVFGKQGSRSSTTMPTWSMR